MNYPITTEVISVRELWKFFNQSASLLCIITADGYFKHVNPSFTRILGHREEELLRIPLIEFIHPDDRKASRGKLFDLIKGDTVLLFRTRFITTRGDYRWLSWTATSPNNDGLVYATAEDCTEKTLLSEELLSEKLNKEKNILEATLLGQEMERVEIGKELHDNVNQMLGTVKLYHEMALLDNQRAPELIKTGSGILMQAINEIRRFSKALVAPEVDSIDLEESIRELTESIMQVKEIIITYSIDLNDKELPGKIKLILFRIIQEQLNNIIKHADAKNVTIKISLDRLSLNLVVIDDGCGFDVNQKKNGIGLKNIICRTSLYKGKINLQSAPGNGCTLDIRIPSHEIFPSFSTKK